MVVVVLKRLRVSKPSLPTCSGHNSKMFFVALAAYLYFLAMEKMIASVVISKIPEKFSGTYRAWNALTTICDCRSCSPESFIA